MKVMAKFLDIHIYDPDIFIPDFLNIGTKLTSMHFQNNDMMVDIKIIVLGMMKVVTLPWHMNGDSLVVRLVPTAVNVVLNLFRRTYNHIIVSPYFYTSPNFRKPFVIHINKLQTK